MSGDRPTSVPQLGMLTLLKEYTNSYYYYCSEYTNIRVYRGHRQQLEISKGWAMFPLLSG